MCSRWGRFQDADESAYHEYGAEACWHPPLLRESSSQMMEHGICADENFLKRTMAGEYQPGALLHGFRGAMSSN